MTDDGPADHGPADRPVSTVVEALDATAPEAPETPDAPGAVAGGDAALAAPDDDVVAAVDPESYASARVVVPRVLGLTGARSVVDVGCGSGAWLRACRDLGVPDVVGVDGAHLPDAHRRAGTGFIERDLGRPLDLDRQFNLAMCLEVGERLPPDRAPGLVADLTSLAPVVLFSAAVPGQGGTAVVTARWPEHWVALFEAVGWTCRDAVRPWIRTHEDVAWRYRQNVFLAVAPSVEAAYTSFPRLDPVRPPDPVDYLRRPPGDVMTPPPEPPPAPVLPPAPTAESEPSPAAAPAPAPPPPPPADPVPEPAGPAATPEPEAGRSFADEGEHPTPPGWDAVRRVAGRVRRRRG